MSTRQRVAARKRPTQQRSRDTVDTIVEATARVLLRDGYEACTTNGVARAAGVSIGSIYQYFPNKESLVLAVMERHLAAMQASLEDKLSHLEDADLPTAVSEMIRAMLEAHRLQPNLHRVLLEQVPRIGALKRLHELHNRYQPLIAAWLEAHRGELGIDNPSTAAYVLIAAVEGVIARVLEERPGWLAQGVLAEHLTRLVLAYLAR